MITGIERAAQMGADAILAFAIINDKDANYDFIKRLRALIEASEKVGLPLIAEYLPTGKEVEQRDALRIITEIGADVIKTNIPQSAEEMKDLLQVTNLPILLAGGSKTEDEEMFTVVETMMNAGANGIVFGRNAWSRDDINGYLQRLSGIILNG
jgi:DhnA family fructose-bisphosphate aldolase class Ia